MKPLILRIKGMYSYQEEAVIDFERLTEGRLFGIFGPVGSGKSTILEAITFALYGRSERLDTKGQNYNLMNLRSNELLIDFTFALAGVGYRFTVQLKRNSKQFEDVRSPKRVAYKDQDGEWIPLEHADGGEILGLSYENFTKTIIIPQGKFQDFLHLTPAARTQMLKELFDLDRFDLSEPANQLLSDAKSRLTGLEGQLKELPAVETAWLREMEEELKGRTQARAELETRLIAMREKTAEMKQLRDLEAGIAEVDETLEVLEQSEPETRQREAQLDRYEQADRGFRELLDRAKDAEERTAQTQKALQGYQESGQRLEKELEKADHQFRLTKTAYEHREEWKAKAEEMKRMAEIQLAEAEIGELKGRLEKGKAVIAEKESSIGALLRESTGAQEALQKMKAEAPDRAELTELRGWARERDRQQHGLQKLRADQQLAVQETASLEKENAELLSQTGEGGLEAAMARQQSLLVESRAAFESLRVHQRLADFAAGLQDGEPCPLCGALEHPEPWNAGHAGHQLKEADAQVQALEKEIERLRQLESRITESARKLAEARERTRKQDLAIAEAAQEQQKHQKAFRWPDFTNLAAEELDRLIDAAREAECKIKEGEELVNRLRESLRKSEDDLRRYREGLAGLEQQKSAATGRRDTLLAQLRIFSWDNYQGKAVEELQAKEHFFTDEYDKVTRNYQREDREIQALKDKLGKLKTEISVETNRLADLQAALKELEQTIAVRLVEYTFADVGAVRELLKLDWKVEEERSRIKAFRLELDKLRSERAALEKQLGGRKFDLKAYQDSQEAMKEHEENARALEQSIGELRNQLAQLGEQLKKRLELEKEKDALQDRAQNLSILSALFRGSGFVNYVSTMYLQELSRRANERFRKLTRNRLSLEVREDNTFVVRDMVNDGQVRSVKTLSGGQTFQASLSLALALSDNIQQRHESRHNLFFLDEGFGTLDRDSLGIVFDTLKELRNEQRIVGVISHVEDLQQEIDLSLNVRQDEERGSLVQVAGGNNGGDFTF